MPYFQKAESVRIPNMTFKSKKYKSQKLNKKESKESVMLLRDAPPKKISGSIWAFPIGGGVPLPGWFGALFLLLEPYNPSKSARKKCPFECGGI